MKLFQKISAGLLLTFGLPILIYGTIEANNARLPPQERDDSLAAVFVFGVPFTGLGCWLAWSLYQDERQRKKLLAKQESDRLLSIFYQILQEQNGEITVLSFAQATHLSGEEATRYLEEKAKEFGAEYNISSSGAIIYSFKM